MTSKEQIVKMIDEEYNSLLKEAAEKKGPDIEKKLETLRKKLEPEMQKFESLGDENLGGSRPHKRVQLKTVSELIDVPVDELMLYVLNVIKNKNTRSLVEWHLGHLYFFKPDADAKKDK